MLSTEKKRKRKELRSSHGAEWTNRLNLRFCLLSGEPTEGGWVRLTGEAVQQLTTRWQHRATSIFTLGPHCRFRISNFIFCFSVVQSSPTLRPHGLKPARLLCPWGFPVKNTGVPSPTHTLSPLSCFAGGFFTTEPPVKPHWAIHNVSKKDWTHSYGNRNYSSQTPLIALPKTWALMLLNPTSVHFPSSPFPSCCHWECRITSKSDLFQKKESFYFQIKELLSPFCIKHFCCSF